MQIMTVNEFLDNLDAVFDKVDAGQRIFVCRGERLYAIIPVTDNAVADGD